MEQSISKFSANILELVIRGFHDLSFNPKYPCKSYTITPCTYETTIEIFSNISKFKIEILLEHNTISNASLVINETFRTKKVSLLAGIKKEQYPTDELFQKIKDEVIKIIHEK